MVNCSVRKDGVGSFLKRIFGFPFFALKAWSAPLYGIIKPFCWSRVLFFLDLSIHSCTASSNCLNVYTDLTFSCLLRNIFFDYNKTRSISITCPISYLLCKWTHFPHHGYFVLLKSSYFWERHLLLVIKDKTLLTAENRTLHTRCVIRIEPITLIGFPLNLWTRVHHSSILKHI